MGLLSVLTVQTVKKLNFQNPRWWTAAILKKTAAISQQPFDRYGWNLAHGAKWFPTGEWGQTVKISNFSKTNRRHLENPQKSRYLHNS